MAAAPAEPGLGILSRTLGSSPTVKWILSARIRSGSRNDVVFVGDTSIQLREFLENGQLTDATGKLDFHTQILDAKVISAKIEIKPTLDAVLDQSGEEERYMVKGEPIDATLPPQILVLSTASSDLLYVYAKEFERGTVRFVFARRALLGGVSLPERYGAHMAVDPESRAIAIAPSMGHCAVFALRPIDEIKSEIDSWKPNIPESFKPTLEQRFVQVDGFILKMEFLRSTSNDPTKVILVLLVSNEGETRLLLYQWDTKLPLIKLRPMRCSGQSLRTEDSFPLMLIPSSTTTSFILITETHMVLYDSVTSTQATRISFALPNDPSVRPSTGPFPPLWTQWAKPRRHSDHNDIHDDVFLVREDGLLLTYLISYKSPTRVEAHFSPGALGLNVDTAFCILAGPRHVGGDVIIAGGGMNDGGVFHLEARGSPVRTQTLSNPSPVQDMILVDPKVAHSATGTKHDRIFICCGNRVDTGAVAEINFGLEAQIGWTVELDDAGSIQKLWTLEIERTSSLWLLTSHPLYTSLLIFDLTTEEAPNSADSSSCPGLDFDSPTLAAAIVRDELVLQITSNVVNLIPITMESAPVSVPLNALQCLCAHINDEDSTFVIAHSTVDGFGITLFSIISNESGEYGIRPLSDPLPISSRPISICSSKMGVATIMVVGTGSGELHGFYIGSEGSLLPLFTRRLQEFDPQLEDVLASSLALLTCKWHKIGLLLCGLRNGRLLCIEIVSRHHGDRLEIELQCEMVHDIGSTAVTVSRESSLLSEVSSALVLCESELKRVTLVGNAAGADYEISNVFLSNRADLSTMQQPMNAVHRIQQLKSVRDDERSGLILCVTDQEILFSSLVAQPQAILRRSFVAGVPKRIAYSRYLKRLVIGIEASSPRRPENLTIEPQMVSGERPHLQLMDVDHRVLELEDRQESPMVAVGEPGERIRALLNWSPTDGSKHYEMVVVALEKDEAGFARKSGRVICLSASKLMRVDLKPRTLIQFPGKAVTALCPLGKSSLLIANTAELVLQNLNVGTRKWSTLCRYTLPSQALSIHTQGSLVFIATVQHSLLILRENKDALTFYASDTVARSSTNVIAFDGTSTLLTTITDRGTDLLAFAEDRISSRLHKLFVATMPLIIDRLRQDRRVQSTNSRRTFHGTSVDGTLYHFTTLQPAERRLLKFLESLCQIDGNTRLHRDKVRPKTHDELLAMDMTISAAERVNPAAMHVRGDVVAMMIEPGPYYLKDLLAPAVKREEGGEAEKEKEKGKENLRSLKDLAEPLIGRNEDTVGAVMIWVRKLLRYPRA